jgi:hypothetical protein
MHQPSLNNLAVQDSLGSDFINHRGLKQGKKPHFQTSSQHAAASGQHMTLIGSHKRAPHAFPSNRGTPSSNHMLTADSAQKSSVSPQKRQESHQASSFLKHMSHQAYQMHSGGHQGSVSNVQAQPASLYKSALQTNQASTLLHQHSHQQQHSLQHQSSCSPRSNGQANASSRLLGEHNSTQPHLVKPAMLTPSSNGAGIAH